MRCAGRRVGRYIGARPVGTRDSATFPHTRRRTRMTMQPASCQAIGIFQPYYIITCPRARARACLCVCLCVRERSRAYTFTRTRIHTHTHDIGTYRVHVRRTPLPPLPAIPSRLPPPPPPSDRTTTAGRHSFLSETYRARAIARASHRMYGRHD